MAGGKTKTYKVYMYVLAINEILSMLGQEGVPQPYPYDITKYRQFHAPIFYAGSNLLTI